MIAVDLEQAYGSGLDHRAQWPYLHLWPRLSILESWLSGSGGGYQADLMHPSIASMSRCELSSSKRELLLSGARSSSSLAGRRLVGVIQDKCDAHTCVSKKTEVIYCSSLELPSTWRTEGDLSEH